MPLIPVKFVVNGREVEVKVRPYERLIDTLRYRLGLTSVKEGCGRGECGACVVIVDDKLIPSCLMLTVQARGRRILTLEGIGSEKKLHPIQKAFIDVQAAQCGFCIPGVIMAAYWLLEVKGNLNPSVDEIKDALSGNLCRCGSYYRFIKAVKLAANELRKIKGKS
ncbi:MAG TPA: (2Fe-2S)-binding protein [Desulfurococcales archaeon]|nr:(2Fe-2S)-binding protein [Desulfurococcales archaeon]